MHSQYIFDFIEIGMAPLMSNRKKVDGNAIFDRQELSREVQEAMLHEVSELAIAVNFIHVQSVADYRAPFHPRPAS